MAHVDVTRYEPRTWYVIVVADFAEAIRLRAATEYPEHVRIESVASILTGNIRGITLHGFEATDNAWKRKGQQCRNALDRCALRQRKTTAS